MNIKDKAGGSYKIFVNILILMLKKKNFKAKINSTIQKKKTLYKGIYKEQKVEY